MSIDPKNPVLRLEQALRHWEDTCYYQLENNAYLRSVGRALPHQADETLRRAPALRSSLLVSGSGDLDIDQFIQPVEETGKALWQLVQLPLMLAIWTMASRRIFQVSSELQALLNATSLNGIRWSDVRLPFPSFAVALPSPIVGNDGRAYDCVMVTQSGGPIDEQLAAEVSRITGRATAPSETFSMLEFRLLPSALGTTSPVSRFDKEHVSKGKARKDPQKVQHWLKRIKQGLHPCRPSVFSFRVDPVSDTPVTTSLKSLSDVTLASTCKCGKSHPEWDAAARIVVGVCLYLSTLPSDRPTTERSEWKPAGDAKKEPRLITSAAEVCMVSTSHRLAPVEREEFLKDRSEEAEGKIGRAHV